MHRLHPSDSVHGRQRDAAHHAVRGNPRVAPPRWKVAEHPLPSLRSPQRAHQVRLTVHPY